MRAKRRPQKWEGEHILKGVIWTPQGRSVEFEAPITEADALKIADMITASIDREREEDMLYLSKGKVQKPCPPG